MIRLKISEIVDPLWNKQLLSSKFGTIYQTKEYAYYIQSAINEKPLFLKFLNEKNDIIAQVLIFKSFKGLKKLKKFTSNNYLISLFQKSSLFTPYIHWSFGPVIFDESRTHEIFNTFGYFLKNQKAKFYGSVHPLQNALNSSSNSNFKTSHLSTFIIDLQQSLEQILNATDKRSVQKNIKRSQERGVSITEISSRDDIIQYYELLNQFRKENNLAQYSYKNFVDGFELLKNVGLKGFLAWYDNCPISAISFSTFNGFINEWGIARTKIDYDQNLYSIDYLRWRIIEWGVENKCNFYDLSGIKIENQTEKEQGIFKNKKKWGGNLFTYDSFSNADIC